jgi:hypothetical protein
MLAVLIGSLVLVGVTSAQVPADLPSAAIAAAKQARVADLDPALPRDTSFDTWLAFVTGRSAAEVGWEANDCGEQSGDPARDRGRDFPLCAEARVTFDDGRVLTIALMVGTWRLGVAGAPAFRFGVLERPAGPPMQIDSLARLAAVIGDVPARRAGSTFGAPGHVSRVEPELPAEAP